MASGPRRGSRHERGDAACSDVLRARAPAPRPAIALALLLPWLRVARGARVARSAARVVAAVSPCSRCAVGRRLRGAQRARSTRAGWCANSTRAAADLEDSTDLLFAEPATLTGAGTPAARAPAAAHAGDCARAGPAPALAARAIASAACWPRVLIAAILLWPARATGHVRQRARAASASRPRRRRTRAWSRPAQSPDRAAGLHAPAGARAADARRARRRKARACTGRCASPRSRARSSWSSTTAAACAVARRRRLERDAARSTRSALYRIVLERCAAAAAGRRLHRLDAIADRAAAAARARTRPQPEPDGSRASAAGRWRSKPATTTAWPRTRTCASPWRRAAARTSRSASRRMALRGTRRRPRASATRAHWTSPRWAWPPATT